MPCVPIYRYTYIRRKKSHADCPMTSRGTALVCIINRWVLQRWRLGWTQPGVVRRRVCLSLLSVSHACARGQRGACVRRESTRVKELCTAPCVRVSCVSRRARERSGRRARTIYSLDKTLDTVVARATLIRTGRVCEFDR